MAKAGKRAHYSVHYIFSLELGRTVLVDSTLKTWLIARADTHPSVSRYELGGPVYSFDAVKPRKGAPPLTTEVPMTVYDGEDRRGYWDVFDDRGLKLTRGYEVKRAHAELEGVGYQVFTTSFFEDNIVERKNTIAAHRWLQSAVGYDTSTIEKGVRLKTAMAAMSFEQLAVELRCNVMEARVASLRLWKRGRVTMRVRDMLLGHPDFRVAGATS